MVSPLMNAVPALDLVEISKTFPGARALRDVSLTLAAGAVHGLVGENGAGKSPLTKIATGALAPDAGRVCVGGIEVHPTRRALRALGVRVYQERQIAISRSAKRAARSLYDASLDGVVSWRRTMHRRPGGCDARARPRPAVGRATSRSTSGS
jgi:ABC-type sugar transport system ATPase subunit